MSEIRKRIEYPSADSNPMSEERMSVIVGEWVAGNLLPADEVDARIAEAARAEREKWAQEAEAWASGSGSNVAESLYRFAAAIREEDQ